MMLAGPELRTVPVTIHIPLAEVPNSADDGADRRHRPYRRRRSREPLRHRQAAAGGGRAQSACRRRRRDGQRGRARSSARPSLRCRAEGIDAFGPLPADTMFHARARASYDVAICMYHDQALIPAKALAFDETVNVTLGLPFIRTSPDHGTAFDIAGKGIARPDSLIAALQARPRSWPTTSAALASMSIDGLPPLRDVIERHGLAGEEVARPEFPARPQPDRQDRARRRRPQRDARSSRSGPAPAG